MEWSLRGKWAQIQTFIKRSSPPTPRSDCRAQMRQRIVSAMLVAVGGIHLLPLSGVFGGERLNALYGLKFDEPNLAILMRHRAVLFGLLGTFQLYAAFRPAFQPAALISGFVSVASFLWIAASVGNYNDRIGRVFAADVAALVCLAVAAIARR
jgi:hypothetical protein